MRRTASLREDKSQQVAELRRVLRVVAHRPRRERLLGVVDDLERDAGWDPVQEIRATHELAALAAELDVARADRAALLAAVASAEADVGRVRRQRDDFRRQLAELRELARPELADELLELRVGLEAQRPTSPPLLVLGQAARLVRAVRAP